MNERKAYRSYLRRCCDRRSILKAAAVLGIGAAGGNVLEKAIDVVRTKLGPLRVSQTRGAMGTFVTMTAIVDSRDHAEQAIGRAFEEIDRLVRIFSRYDPSTPLSMWNRDGVVTDAPRELVMLVERAIDVYHVSEGAFDVTVQPLVDLFRTKSGTADVTRSEIADALARTGSHRIEIAHGRLRFLGEGMGVTLDGIAKGYIVDRASQVLAANGVDRHLVNAGGDIRVSGGSPPEVTWRIAVQDPGKRRGSYPDIIRMRNGAVATSGDYEVFFDRDRVHHHVVDPRLGSSPHHSTSVSVAADDVMMADALSTAVFVMERREGLGMIESLGRCASLVLGRDGRAYRSSGWESLKLANG